MRIWTYVLIAVGLISSVAAFSETNPIAPIDYSICGRELSPEGVQHFEDLFRAADAFEMLSRDERGVYVLNDSLVIHDGTELLMRLESGTLYRIHVAVVRTGDYTMLQEDIFVPVILPGGIKASMFFDPKNNPGVTFASPTHPSLQHQRQFLAMEDSGLAETSIEGLIYPPVIHGMADIVPVRISRDSPPLYAAMEYFPLDERVEIDAPFSLNGREIKDGEEFLVKYPDGTTYELVKVTILENRLYIPAVSNEGIKGSFIFRPDMGLEFARVPRR